MKLAFSKSTGGPSETQELFSLYRGIGYDGLQLKANQYEQYLDEPGRFLDDHPEPGAASGLITSADLDQEGLAKLRRVFSFGRSVSAELVILVLSRERSDVDGREGLRSIARGMSEIGKEAVDMGLKLSLHHHYGQAVMLRPEFDQFFDAVVGDTVGLTVDTAHLVKSGVLDIAEIIGSFSGRIDNYHLKDYKDGEWRVLGEGDIDFGPVFRAIRECGYDGWVSTDEESGADVKGSLQSCYSYMVKGIM